MGQFKYLSSGIKPALFVTAMVLAGVSSISVAGTSTEQLLQKRERNFQMLMAKVENQDKLLAEQKKIISNQRDRLRKQQSSPNQQSASKGDDSWWQGVEMSGVIELEAAYVDPYAGDHESDLVVVTAEIGIAAQVTDWVAGEISLLYEEDETDLEVDVATITIANDEYTLFSFTGG